ncbi:MAG: diaminopimelate decarboxylase [Peptococcaceae bacterium]|nr:diaminopimelate decarboxylase [Peptococcaceae bacterium]
MLLQGTMRVNDAGHLVIGDCDTVELAREFGTPLYVLDEQTFRAKCRAYYQAFTAKTNADVIYAGKSLLTLAICRLVEEEGLCLDVVSGGELFTAIKAGFPMSRIYFHGNNKSVEELLMGIEAGIHRFIVDNIRELYLLQNLASQKGRQVDILLRLTPGIEAHTHDYIKTGQIDSKFGLAIATGQAMEGVREALRLTNIRLRGLHCHIGSQIFELEPYADAARILLQFAREAKDATGWEIEELNLGGGLGIYYAEGDRPPEIADLAETIIPAVHKYAREFSLPVPKILVEPGRSIAGPSGITLYTVGTIKTIPGIRTYVSVDGGMTDNLRPALYGARYEACVANKMHMPSSHTVSLAGKCCESGDMLIWDIIMPPLEPDDIIAVPSTGAYTYTMASNYNRIPRPAMITVLNGQAELILKRESYDDLIRNDIIPERLMRKVTTEASK